MGRNFEKPTGGGCVRFALTSLFLSMAVPGTSNSLPSTIPNPEVSKQVIEINDFAAFAKQMEKVRGEYAQCGDDKDKLAAFKDKYLVIINALIAFTQRELEFNTNAPPDDEEAMDLATDEKKILAELERMKLGSELYLKKTAK